MLLNCGVRLLRVPWTARRSTQSILKEISSGSSLEGLMLKLKLQYFGHLMRRADSLEKTLMLGKIEGRRKRGRQRMRRKGDDRGWDGWMASPTQWTWVWVGSGSWCQTGRPGMLQLMGSQRVGHAWATELNWTMPSFLKLDSYSPQIREYKTLLTFPITRKACKLSFNILLRIAQIPIPR